MNSTEQNRGRFLPASVTPHFILHVDGQPVHAEPGVPRCFASLDHALRYVAATLGTGPGFRVHRRRPLTEGGPRFPVVWRALRYANGRTIEIIARYVGPTHDLDGQRINPDKLS